MDTNPTPLTEELCPVCGRGIVSLQRYPECGQFSEADQGGAHEALCTNISLAPCRVCLGRESSSRVLDIDLMRELLDSSTCTIERLECTEHGESCAASWTARMLSDIEGSKHDL